jgi:hypothetical protein
MMRTTLKISLLANLGLSGVLVFVWVDGRKAPSESTPPMLPATQPMPAAVPATMPAPAPQVERAPFSWGELASADYSTYVKNLRRIGCPEPTLRAIVTADVDAKYRERSGELEKKLDDLNNGSWSVQLSSYQDQQALKMELEKLPAEESADINNLLGAKPVASTVLQPMVSAAAPASGGPSTGSQMQAQADNNQAGNKDVASTSVVEPNSSSISGPGSTSGTMGVPGQAALTLSGYQLPPKPQSAAVPLVFQPVDQAAVNLNPAQQQTVNNLQQQFINNVGGSGQNPADPAYQQTWQQAQAQSDQMTIVQLGYNAYMQYWLAQYQNSLASQTQPPQ